MKLSSMLEACLRGGYTQVENGGDFRFAWQGDRLWIYFAHSEGAVDWKNNLDFPAKASTGKEPPRLLAHRGFLRVWQSIEPYVAPAIADARTKSVTVVGYSHGAALALLCFDYILRVRPTLKDTVFGYGFGCPRVLWGIPTKDTRAHFAHFTVIRALDDIVTHLPPAALGYFHVGQMFEIGEKGKYSRIDAHRTENILAELRRTED